MRKIYIILGVVVLILVLVLGFGSRYGIRIGGFTLALNKDKKLLEDRTRRFWEDIQYKDFKKAAKYHESKVQKNRDIPYLLERLFKVKPEFLDVRSIDVQEVTIDSSGKRGRSRTVLTVKILNTKKIKKPEAVLYWYKKDGKWFMRLESSLRALSKRK